ncbi:hypothetical protein [Agriterribacter sp.]|nr:hypothetical protein [Agriterribacter sp.]HTN06747.1 hypothetical protein [Agriterribacter sp.]
MKSVEANTLAKVHAIYTGNPQVNNIYQYRKCRGLLLSITASVVAAY